MADPTDANGPRATPAKKPGDLSDAVRLGAQVHDIVGGFLGEPETTAAELRWRLTAEEDRLRGPVDLAMTAARNRPTIAVNRLEQFAQIQRAWEALLAANTPPTVFRRGGEIVSVSEVWGRLTIRPCLRAEMNGRLMRCARWVRVSARSNGDEVESPTEVPHDIALDLLALPSDRLPVLRDLIRCPVFDNGGRLIADPGYDTASQLYLAPNATYTVPRVPDRPGSADVRLARTFLTETWLGDFPFASESDRTHAIALLLLPLVRNLFRGPAPLHLIGAAERGTGKSLLAKVLMIPALGEAPDPSTPGSDTEETRKKITSMLVKGRQVVWWDNVDGRLDSADLAAVLTAETWEDRTLGQTEMVRMPNRAAWIMTANNADISTDIARRSIRIHLNRNMERPWEWRGARIADLEAWTLQHRTRILEAALTLVQSWLSAGHPSFGSHLGSFEAWAQTLGGILIHAGFSDFLANSGEMHAQTDRLGGEWRNFIRSWWEKFGEQPRFAGDLAEFAHSGQLLLSVIGGATSDSGRAGRFGKAIAKQRDRIFSGLKIVEHQSGHRNTYQLECIRPSEMAWAQRRPTPSG